MIRSIRALGFFILSTRRPASARRVMVPDESAANIHLRPPRPKTSARFQVEVEAICTAGPPLQRPAETRIDPIHTRAASLHFHFTPQVDSLSLSLPARPCVETAWTCTHIWEQASVTGSVSTSPAAVIAGRTRPICKRNPESFLVDTLGVDA
ncbi:hypothetical protein K504DRAFT_251024 [Pleomassaria siparia CBS 279.74]|uniref:Uncharacterized protein n=1 Tax=Pleomassaria siparia CBS 279.74 TaxID=1314801 RepID=A0A6G1KBD1_9PLEO|nr:hypothetical protein K504DRAFT_251024 [Pleomassaria siparia CBS 279.74]